ncbi:MAG: SNF2-related protein [Spirochaetes bacterium]|nr:SNF2-related protein [Spirochaetota bacterium]
MPKKHVFGTTVWGAYFISAMERMADSGRLDRGRSYAGNGKVRKLAIKDGLATARVAGNYQPYYDVSIRFHALSNVERDRVFALVESDPMLLGRIASGELPERLLQGLKKQGVELLPRTWSDMKRSCDCPDCGDPCKHQAAVYYVIAQEIDRDPSALFRLRGVDLEAKYRAPRPEEAATGRGSASPKAGAKTRGGKDPENGIPEPVGIRWVKSWPEADGGGIEEVEIASYGKVIPRLLPPGPPLASVDLVTSLTGFYHELAARWDIPFRSTAASPRDDETGDAKARAFARREYRVQLDGYKLSVIDEAGRATTPLAAARSFLALPPVGGSPSFSFLSSFFRTMRSIAAAGALFPDVRASGNRFECVWKPARFGSDVAAALEGLARVAVEPGRSGAFSARLPDRASFVGIMACAFLTEYVRALGFASQASAASPVWLALFHGETIDASAPAIRSLPRALHSRFAVFELAASRTELELSVRPSRAAQADYALSAFVRGADGAWTPLAKAFGTGGADAYLFPALLSNFVPGLSQLGKRQSVALPEKDLASLVVDAAPLLVRLGVSVVFPRELTRLASPRAVLVPGKVSRARSLAPSLGAAATLSFDWKVSLGEGELVDPGEFARMLAKGVSLARFRSGFVRLDAAEAAAILEKIARVPKPGALDAIREQLANGEPDASGERSIANAFANLLSTARKPGKEQPRAIEPPAGLKAKLRPYQERGYRWLRENLGSGFGCVLADDMGLGKTVQAIALALSLKESGALAHGALVIAPATLLTNWERELARFAPGLSVALYYGLGRKAAAVDVTLTTYETFHRDEKKLLGSRGEKAWDLVVLDEAHIVKNPEAKRSKAVKRIPSLMRIALSGTPVENNLAELWSIFDFAIPGYLGSLADFTRDYRVPIETRSSKEDAARLRRICSPFLLRRLKTDKTVIADLPDKITVDEYATLSPEQAALYEAAVREGLDRISGAGGIARRGMVLALITALKQIGNHPRNWDKESPDSAELSGKARLLVALLEPALESGEKVLVFSQYVEMLDILAAIVEDNLGMVPRRLQGGMSKARRDAEVDAFQAEAGPGVFLLSLRAGGVGLNLTAASRVVHYDLWFNPAVENQATDRAFRIGQTKNVFVHRLITRGTLEERINETLQSKKALAELTVGSGETWISELGDGELRELVELR